MARDFIRSLPEHERSITSSWLKSIHIDPILLFLVMAVVGYGLIVLYSAVSQSQTLFQAQLLRLSIAFVVLIVAAQLPPDSTCVVRPFSTWQDFYCWQPCC